MLMAEYNLCALWLRQCFPSHPPAYNDVNREDVLVPPFHSDDRTASPTIGRIIIVLSLVINCAIQMPSIFQSCGLLITSVMMFSLAFLTNRTLGLLWITARRSGANTYGGVARLAFGFEAHWITSGLVFLYTLFLLITSFIIVRDTLAPIVGYFLPALTPDLTLFWLVTMLGPVYLQKGLHKLNCHLYTSFIGIIIFVVLLGISSLMDDGQRNLQLIVLQEAAGAVQDVISSLNIFLISFSACFNMLEVQSVVVQPTGDRVFRIAQQSVWLGTLFLYLAGLFGYLANNVEDETLKHISKIANVVCGLTVWVATPVLMIPCRDNILEMIETLHSDGRCPEVSDCQDEIDTWTTRSSTQTSYHSNIWTVGEETNLLTPIEENPDCGLIENPWAIYISTFCIMIVSYCAALLTLTPVVWSILGPFLSIGLNFGLPAACSLTIQQYRIGDNQRGFSRNLLAVSLVGVFICTLQALLNLMEGHGNGNGDNNSNDNDITSEPSV